MSPAEENVVRRSARNGWLLSGPALAVLAMAAVGPLLVVVIYSFLTAGTHGNVVWAFSLEGWNSILWSKDIFTDSYVWADAHLTIFWRSVKISLLTTIITFLVGLPTAWFIATRPPKSRAFWLFLITIPFWTSYLVRVFLWKVILGFNGVINSGLISLGIIDDPLTWINVNVGAIVMTLAHAYAPFAILPIFVALEKIDRSLLEAGRDLGESAMTTFWRVTLPLAMPGVVGAVLIVFIPTVGDYVTPDIIGGGKIPLIANVIQKLMLGIDNMPLGSAVAVSAMLIVGAAAALFVLLNARFLKVKK